MHSHARDTNRVIITPIMPPTRLAHLGDWNTPKKRHTKRTVVASRIYFGALAPVRHRDGNTGGMGIIITSLTNVPPHLSSNAHQTYEMLMRVFTRFFRYVCVRSSGALELITNTVITRASVNTTGTVNVEHRCGKKWERS